jgi:hypothetical protein
MFHLRRVNLGLIDAGRSAQLERAASISSDSVAEIALGPPSPAQLQELLDREEAIAKAVDERYARLGHAVTSDRVFEGVLLDELVQRGLLPPVHAAMNARPRPARHSAPSAALAQARATARHRSPTWASRQIAAAFFTSPSRL